MLTNGAGRYGVSAFNCKILASPKPRGAGPPLAGRLDRNGKFFLSILAKLLRHA
jgi:hypothetical protein